MIPHLKSIGSDNVCTCLCCVQTVQRDIDDIQGDILRIKDMILMEVEGMADADKAQFLRSDIGGITQRLGVLDSSLSAYLQRYNDTHKCSHMHITINISHS